MAPQTPAPDMEKYRRLPPAKAADAPPPDEAVVRVQVQGKVANYVTYAAARLEDPSKANVQIIGLGRAINTAVTVAEILRRKVADLHQLTILSSVALKDRWEPLEEGLDPIETERTVSCITVHLVKGDASTLDTSAPGYSPPLETDESAMVPGAIDAADRERTRSFRGRGGHSGFGRGSYRGARRGRGGGGGPRRGHRGASTAPAVNGNGTAAGPHAGASHLSSAPRNGAGHANA